MSFVIRLELIETFPLSRPEVTPVPPATQGRPLVLVHLSDHGVVDYEHVQGFFSRCFIIPHWADGHVLTAVLLHHRSDELERGTGVTLLREQVRNMVDEDQTLRCLNDRAGSSRTQFGFIHGHVVDVGPTRQTESCDWSYSWILQLTQPADAEQFHVAVIQKHYGHV
ncbi:hypothetical protein D3C84_355820 [compost metagenome]